jgi:HAD superfamily hydrolase (TIGR01549 family)
MLNVLFDLGNTVLMFPAGGLESEGELSRKRSSLFESLVKVTYDSLVKSGIDVGWSSFFTAYKVVRAQQIKQQKQILREYDMKERLARVLQALGCRASSHSKSIDHALEDYFKAYTEHVTIEKDTRLLLENLHLNRKLGLITNFAYPPCIHKMLQKFHINHVFDAVAVSGEIGWAKPSPKIFNHALSLLKSKPNQAVFVGDDPETDIKGAKNVGMKTILLSPQKTSNHADATIPHLTKLPAAIKELEQINTG